MKLPGKPWRRSPAASPELFALRFGRKGRPSIYDVRLSRIELAESVPALTSRTERLWEGAQITPIGDRDSFRCYEARLPRPGESKALHVARWWFAGLDGRYCFELSMPNHGGHMQFVREAEKVLDAVELG